MTETLSKPSVCADVKICPDLEKDGIVVSAEIPGVKKEDVELRVSSDSFCVVGERDDLRYDCCYQLPCDVNAAKSYAKFENGLLTVNIPFTEALKGEKIEIH